MADFLDDVQQKLGQPGQPPVPQAAPATQVVDPFKVTPQMAKDAQTTVDRARQTDDLMTGFIAAASENDKAKEQVLSQQVAAKQGILAEADKDTESLKATAVPIFQRRQAIADREADLAAMNPLKRGIMSIFSLSHNQTWLEQQDKALANRLQTHAQSYQTLMGLRADKLKQIDAEAENQTALNDLHVTNMGLDVQRHQQLTGSASQIFSTEVQGLEGQVSVLRAQGAARADILSGLTAPQVNAALADATSKGGQTVINGVTLRAGELKDLSMQWKEKDISLQSRALALQASQLNLAEAHEQRYWSHASLPEIENAMRTGKMPDGTSANQELLGRAFIGAQQRNQAVAGAVGQSGNLEQLVGTTKALATDVARASQRASTLFSNLPPEMQVQADAITTQISGLAGKVAEAQSKGVGEQYATQALAQIQELRQKYRKVVTDQAAKWGGGDKDLTAIAVASMTGDALNPMDSAQGLIKLARTGLPPGTQLTPQAQGILNQVKTVVTNYDSKGAPGMNKPGDAWSSFASGGKKPNPKEVSTDLTQEVIQTITKAYTGSSLTEGVKSAPTLARTVPDSQDPTKPHPFTRVNPQDYYQAVATGDEMGYQVLAKALGINANEAKRMFTKPTDEDTKKTLKMNGADGRPETLTFAEAKTRLTAIQTSQMLTALDHSNSATPGFKPSSAYVDLWSNPDFQNKLTGALDSRSKATSAGDYAIHSIAGTQLGTSVQGFSGLLQRQAAANDQQQYQRRVQVAAKLRNSDPVTSALITVHSVPGLDTASGNRLVTAIANQYQADRGAGPAADVANLAKDAVLGQRPFADYIDQTIMQGKFQDPQLERIRQIAAKDWTKNRAAVDKGIGGMIEAFSSSPLNPFSSSSVFGAAAQGVSGNPDSDVR